MEMEDNETIGVLIEVLFTVSLISSAEHLESILIFRTFAMM